MARCSKTGYPSREAAERALSMHRAKNLTTPAPCRVYECSDCNCWHLTSRVAPLDPDLFHRYAQPRRRRKMRGRG